jgi:hypothetical protein
MKTRIDFLAPTTALALLILNQTARADPLDTWKLRFPFAQSPQIDFSAITYGQGEFVTVAATYGTVRNGFVPLSSAIFTCADGVNWIQRQTSIQAGRDSGLYGISYGNGLFVAVGGYYQQKGPSYVAIVSSGDGANWVQGQSGTEGSLNSVAYGSGQFVAVGYNGTILTSADGFNWIERRSGTGEMFLGVAYGNGRFVAVGRAEESTVTKGDVLSSPIILTSADGVNWVAPVFGAKPYTGLNAVSYGSGQFIAVGTGYFPDLEEEFRPVILTSSDGTNWVQQHSAAQNGLHAITYASGQFVTAGSSGAILTSHDGVTWAQRASGTQNSLGSIAYGNGRFVAVGRGGMILESGSIITLRITPTVGTGLLELSLEGPTGLAYAIQSSTDLISWLNLTNIISNQPTNFIFGALPFATDHLFYRANSQ